MTVIEDFEYASQSDFEAEYSGDTAYFSLVSSNADGEPGSQSLESETNYSHSVARDVTSQTGNKYECYVNLDSEDSILFFLGVQSFPHDGGLTGSYYQFGTLNYNRIVIYRRDNGSSTQLADVSADIPYNAWLRFVVEWGTDGSLTFTVYDSTDSQIGQATATDTTYTSGGIGFWTSYTNQKFDHLTESSLSSGASVTESASVNAAGGVSLTESATAAPVTVAETASISGTTAKTTVEPTAAAAEAVSTSAVGRPTAVDTAPQGKRLAPQPPVQPASLGLRAPPRPREPRWPARSLRLLLPRRQPRPPPLLPRPPLPPAAKRERLRRRVPWHSRPLLPSTLPGRAKPPRARPRPPPTSLTPLVPAKRQRRRARHRSASPRPSARSPPSRWTSRRPGPPPAPPRRPVPRRRLTLQPRGR